MVNVKTFKLLGVLLALILIVWAITPFLRHQPITNDVMASAIILISKFSMPNPLIFSLYHSIPVGQKRFSFLKESLLV